MTPLLAVWAADVYSIYRGRMDLMFFGIQTGLLELVYGVAVVILAIRLAMWNPPAMKS